MELLEKLARSGGLCLGLDEILVARSAREIFSSTWIGSFDFFAQARLAFQLSFLTSQLELSSSQLVS
jgi:hypothetical protein